MQQRADDPADAVYRALAKFRGYDVFPFGHADLRNRDSARPDVTGFFRTLLGPFTHQSSPVE
ncbi:hypothetical protein ABT040_29030 [Streptomyces sp. NPDC002688]|uniref:hypothetical protein n=1 Tax=Streptomyces sp. NPDC002688 TaxID=3154423 RepID=UPI003320D6D0